MNVAKIKEALLASVGNPETGAISEYADVMAEAIAKELDDCCAEPEVKSFTPVKETRVLEAPEAH